VNDRSFALIVNWIVPFGGSPDPPHGRWFDCDQVPFKIFPTMVAWMLPWQRLYVPVAVDPF